MAFLQGTEFYISKRVGKAMTDYDMLCDGDRIIVAVSGGKDSLTMLRVLEDRRRFVPIKYELLAVYVDSGYPRSHARSLKNYFEKIGVAYHIEKIDIFKDKKSKNDINCFWCAWNRRKALFEVADRLGYKKVAFGHHKDDIAQTIMLNLFFHGETSSMCPKQELFGGKITILRPLAYVEEKMIKRFVKESRLPVKQYVCDKADGSQRAEMARIIRKIERFCPEIKTNILRSVRRVKKDYLLQ